MNNSCCCCCCCWIKISLGGRGVIANKFKRKMCDVQPSTENRNPDFCLQMSHSVRVQHRVDPAQKSSLFLHIFSREIGREAHCQMLSKGKCMMKRKSSQTPKIVGYTLLYYMCRKQKRYRTEPRYLRSHLA